MLASLLLAAAAALPAPIPANLDSDPALEQLAQRETTCWTEGTEHAPPCLEDDIGYEQASIIDDCGTVDLLKEPHETFVDAKVVEADGDPARAEVLVEGYSGAAGRVGEARLLRGADACGKPRVLFQIPSTRWRTRKPRRASYASTGTISVREVDARFPGREVVLRQPWYRRTDGGCCPSWVATAVFRYDPAGGRYVKARERVARTGRPTDR